MTKVDLWNESTTEEKYLITAGINRYGRQQYVIVYPNMHDWVISAVPIPMNKTIATKALVKIRKEYQERINSKITFKHKYSNIEFDIIKCPDNLII